MRIMVGQGSCGIAAGAEKVYDALESEIGKGLMDADLQQPGALECVLEPIVDVYVEDELHRYVKVSEEEIPGFVEALKRGLFDGETLKSLK